MGRLARPTVLALALALSLVAATPALGATRFAAVGGDDTGNDCTLASDPCSLDNAFAQSGNGDEISLAAGTYSPITQLGMGRTGLDVHGPLGTQSARVNADIGGAALTIDAGHLHDLSISNSNMSGWAVQAQGAGTGSAGVVENVEIDASGSATGIKIGSESESGIPVLRNSVVTTTGAPAVWTQGDALIQNVDAYASAGPTAVGMFLSGGATTAVVVNVVNSIARGSDSTRDMVLNDGSMHATLNVSYSDTRGISGDPATFGEVNTSNNITGDPQLVNTTLGDFHETALSPTRDKGIATGTGGVDLDWQPRIIGSAPDIGADELALAPSGSTDAAGDVTGSSATLHGTLNPNGLVTDYHFEYGTSPTSLGSTAGTGQLPAGATSQAVAAPLSALAAGTTVYYRLVASNAQGGFAGSVQSFTTTTPPVTPPKPVKPRVKFKAAKQHLKSHKLVFTLTSLSALKANGKITFKGKTLAKFSKKLHTGANKITLKLSKKALKALTKALKHHKTLSLRLTVALTGAGHQTHTLKLTR